MLYDGWLLDIAARFQTRFNQIKAEFNFDFGPEFEIALATVLREFLPQRAGVCRGFVVSADGRKAGDDIIIYDKSRFPTLRSLGDDLAKKEQIPFEGVLAYVEAKHRLDLEGRGDGSLEKALAQIAAVKSRAHSGVTDNTLVRF
jgi:hypothetical protein